MDSMRKLTQSRLVLAASLTLASLGASAAMDSQQVVITKATDSRTLTVRYTGAKATLAELRINGVTAGTRAITTGQSSGETNFTLDTSKLLSGENSVEIRLFDAAGKVLGSEKTTVTIDRTTDGPVFLTKPKNGSTLQGMVEIAVGFKYELKSAYVSFFLDDEFKSLKNYAPYSFLWDTSKATNGWHEVEAWVVDENSTTFRTQRMRVFVNNPGGRTERETNSAGSVGSVEPRETVVAPAKPVVPKVTPPVTPKTASVVALATSENTFNPVLSKPSGTKPTTVEPGIMTSQRVMRPTGQRVAGIKPVVGTITQPKLDVHTTATVKTAPTKGAAKPVIDIKQSNPGLTAVATPKTTSNTKPVGANVEKAAKLTLTYGSKMPDIGYFPIYINGDIVNFDVMPRVDNGIALTPFRHLFEHVGGKVKWEGQTKTVLANGLGSDVNFQIGKDFAMVNGGRVGLERNSFLDQGRAVVPLSFVQKLLNVEIQYDPSTQHVLITKPGK